MDPDVRKEILARIDRDARPRTPLILYSLGLLLIVSPLIPARLVEGVGGWDGIVRFLVGILFLYVGATVHERLRLGRAFRELVESFEAFNQGLYGRNYKTVRAAVDLLIRTLASSDPEVRSKIRRQLVRITGVDFGEDRGRWEEWWREHRASFGLGPEGDIEPGAGYPGPPDGSAGGAAGRSVPPPPPEDPG